MYKIPHTWIYPYNEIPLHVKKNELLKQQHGWISKTIYLRKEARHTRLHIIKFYLYDILEQEELNPKGQKADWWFRWAEGWGIDCKE